MYGGKLVNYNSLLQFFLKKIASDTIDQGIHNATKNFIISNCKHGITPGGMN